MRTRHFGVLIPSTNTTVEIEFTRHLPPDLQFHVGRCGKDAGSPFGPSRDADVAHQSRMLGDAKVEAVSLVQTSASLHEDGYDARVRAMIEAGAGAPASTSAEAIGEAVQALGARRIAIASPYSAEMIGRAKAYYESRYGLDVVAAEGFGATNAYAIGALSADAATEAFRRMDLRDVEVLLVPGGNFPTYAHIAAWERAFARPVVATNQAALWAMLRAMGVSAPLPGWGRLLEQRPDLAP